MFLVPRCGASICPNVSTRALAQNNLYDFFSRAIGHMVGAEHPRGCEGEKTCVMVLTLLRFIGWFAIAGMLVKLKWRWIV